MSEPIQLTVTTSIRDTLAAAQLYQTTTMKHRIYQAVAGVLFVLALWQGFSTSFGGNQLMLIVIALLLALDPVPLILMVMSSFNQPHTTSTLLIDDTGITRVLGERTVLVPWTKLNYSIENRNYVLLVAGSWNYIVIPQRSFTTPQLKSSFVQQINTHLKASK
jgi:hypothetical protein